MVITLADALQVEVDGLDVHWSFSFL